MFSEKLKNLPEEPGVYLMLDEAGEIIYVGKAKSLKNRVRQYFQFSGNKTAKVQAMVSKIADFRYILTRTEVEALVLESNLIKKHAPKYNILLKDDKNYPFLKLNLKEEFPRLEVVRTLKNDGSKYFGPYMNGISVKDILELIGSAFPLRVCAYDFSKSRPARPCLNYHIGRCLAPCSGKVDAVEYRRAVEEVISFLKGNDKNIEKILTDKMKEHSASGNFEMAIFYRDKLKILEKLLRRQIAALPKDFNLDIFASASDGIKTVYSVISVRGGKITSGDNFSSDGLDDQTTSFISQYYSINPVLCDEVVLNSAEDEKVLEQFLADKTGRKINVIVPRQGVRKQMLEMAEKNAADFLEASKKRDEKHYGMTVGAVSQLAEFLSLDTLPMRIEAFDISHISGTDMVASMVVFKGGEPAKKHYRKFKIKTVAGNNDFLCMKEALSRRLKNLEGEDESFSEIPDLILIDGGKGQLAFAKEALAEAGRENINILALAKRKEEVFLGKTPIILPKNSLALTLLQRVRDEAHRFAVDYHRNLRSSRLRASGLLKIEGLGEKRAAALIKHFKSIEKIKQATVEELVKVKGMPQKTAEKIFEFYHKNPENADETPNS
ncbi:MAG TPA: excinuclease ABC subunit UvrC [Clostridia bacterium]|nr:excinuclease ABC subunit UvrC [Clostridia bacterium]